jgi:hypothetical protein
MDKTFEDLDEEKLLKLKNKYIEYNCLYTVCLAYLAAFDKNIKEKTVDGARKANIIRDNLVKIIKLYTPGYSLFFTLNDNGDIGEIRCVINKLAHHYKIHGAPTGLERSQSFFVA